MKPAGDRVIEFFYDFISPNVYLVWTQLEALAERYDYRIQPVPVLFAGFLKKYGQLGPAEVLPKNEWMVRNNLRKAALLGVPLNPPPYHPFNPLLALRVACLPGLDQHCLIGHVLRAVWVDRQYISDPGVFERVLSEAGFDGARLIELAGLAAAREALKRHTDDAINRGVFGVPTMGVGDELFWGYDDLNFLERT
ncbi:MAG: 2-hydroxychromene-2-carboxylate isomerase, partial [Gammaproteobacteria bacterium]|nr:2-hydroxychromene-2-carboxylate isomerase [Gammaproteobacteria bacterium]